MANIVDWEEIGRRNEILKARTISGIVLTMLLFGTLALAFQVQPVKAVGTIYIRADGSVDPPTAPIQRDGDLYTLTDNIMSDSGSDGIVIERNNMTLNGAGYTVLGRSTLYSAPKGIALTGRTNVIIKNFSITGFGDGIRLESSSNNTMSGNNLVGNHISEDGGNGVTLYFSSNNTISANYISSNGGGVALDFSSLNIITRNTISDNLGSHGYGFSIHLDQSSENNTISENILTGRTPLGIYATNNTVWGNKIHCTDENYAVWVTGNNSIVSFNEITGWGGIGLWGSEETVQGNTIAAGHGITLYGSKNTIHENNITSGAFGVQFYASFNNTISGNNVRNNAFGVYLSSSSFNVFSENNISDNALSGETTYGVWLGTSSNNKFYHNNFIDNGRQAYFDAGYANVWDDGYPSGGNFWSDYSGADSYSGPYQNQTGSDGIGDWPYLMAPGNRDNYPHMKPVIPYYKFNVALANVLPAKTVMPSGSSILVNATVESLGPYPHPSVTFNITLKATYNYEHTPRTRNITLEANAAQGWNFSTPGPTITANISDTVVLLLEAADSVHHKFYVDYNGNGFPDADEPQTAPFINTNETLTFALDRLGTFTYYCAYYQDTMVGSLVVNPLPPPPIIEISSQTVTLEGIQEKNITLTWNTLGFAKGNYTLSAYVSPIAGETDTADNAFTGGSVYVAILADITGPDPNVPDGKVDIRDIATIAKHFGDFPPDDHSPGTPDYVACYNADISGPTVSLPDGKIDIRDLGLAAKNYGKIDP